MDEMAYHDLRKDKRDLPRNGEKVIVCLMDGMLTRYIIASFSVDTFFWQGFFGAVDMFRPGKEAIGWKRFERWKEVDDECFGKYCESIQKSYCGTKEKTDVQT